MSEHYYPCILHGAKKEKVRVKNEEERKAAYELGFKDSPADFKSPEKVDESPNPNTVMQERLAAKVKENKRRKEADEQDAARKAGKK